MYKLADVVLVLTLAVPAPAAEKTFDPEGRARAVAPYLDEQAYAVAHLDFTRIKPEKFLAKLAEWGKMDAEEVNAHRKILDTWLTAFTQAGGQDVYAVFSLADLTSAHPPETPFLIVPLEKGSDARAIAKLLSVGGYQTATSANGQALLAGSKSVLKRLRKVKPTRRPELVKAFTAAGDTAGQFLVLPTADMRRVVDELLPTLPKEVGGGSGKALTRGLLWAAFGLDLPPTLTVKLIVQSQDAASAQALRDLLVHVLKGAGRSRNVRRSIPNYDKLVASVIPRVAGNRLKLEDKGDDLTQLAAGLMQVAQQAARRNQSMTNLREIGTAMWNYYDKHKGFVMAATYDKQGKPLLSWRVQLLPFLGETKLYKEFHQDEPWDSAHNKKLIARIPAVYRSPNHPQLTRAGKTTSLAPLGKDTMFSGRKPLTIRDVTDGTSNTIFIVEAALDRAVVWTKPDDLKIDPKKPLAGLVNKHRDGFPALFVDGSVRYVPDTVSATNLHALFTRNGSEVIIIP